MLSIFFLGRLWGDLAISIVMRALVIYVMYHTLENPDIKLVNQLTLAKNQAEKSNNAKSDFLSSMSHELRTPLTLIEGPLNQLVSTNDIQKASKEVTGLFAIVQRNTHQLSEIINKMLDMQVKGKVENNHSIEEVNVASVPLTKEDSHMSQTILIVDDNADVRAYLRNILQNQYQINEAADGQQGLALANEIVPDLIVSDVMMPIMNGLEFCHRVKDNVATSHIPVILLTARAMSHHQIEGYESGADAYITKPFSADLLQARISNLLASRIKLKELFTTTTNSEEKESVTEKANEQVVKEDAFFKKFCDFVEHNMTDSDLSVETIGAELGLSRVQLYRKIKALTGLSPIELLRKARLQKAKELIKGTDKTIAEVAYEVGFTAPSYFTKCFKEEFGISPSDI
jgi:DNA-binding response OmpR family regulator